MPDKIDIAELEKSLNGTSEMSTHGHHSLWGYAAGLYLDMIKWNPINTAPKDGTIILVKTGVAHWYLDGWYSLTGLEYPGRPIQWNVEHWLPLPTPPTGEKK